MSWKSVLGKTLLGASILFATVIYTFPQMADWTFVNPSCPFSA